MSLRPVDAAARTAGGIDSGLWIRLGIGLLLSVLTVRWLPLASADPFRQTLVVFPLVVAGLLEIGRWARALGGRRTPPAVAATEAVALGVSIVLVLGRRHLGLRYTDSLVDGLLAAGLLLLLAHRVWRLLMALRPSLGHRLPNRLPAVFFFLPLVVYVAILPWANHHRPPDGDEPYYLLVTHSLAYDFDAVLNNNYDAGDSLRFMPRRIGPQFQDPVGADGEQYSRHNLTLPVLLAPFYRLGGKLATLAVMAALSAALAWSILRLMRHDWRRHPGEALVAYALTAFAAPLLIYSYQVWVEVPAVLLITLVLDQVLSLERDEPPGRRQALAILLPLVVLPLLKLRFVLIVGPLLLLAFWRAGRPARRLLVLFGLGLAALGAAILTFNQLAYGNPLKYLHWEALQGSFMRSPDQYLRGFLGLYYDSSFGLFAYAPIWLLLLPAALLLAARRHRLFFIGAWLLAPYMVALGSRGEWYGGWSPPFRYGLVALPFLALAMVPLLVERRRPGARALLAFLGVLTLALSVLWTVLPGWTYNLANGRSHLLDHLSGFAGADITRFFPSSVRPRAATSWWPPVSLAIIVGLWWRPRHRLRHAAAWGLVVLLPILPLLVVAAHRIPTRLAEIEDPWISKSGGSLHPDVWTRGRIAFRGGWQLPAGQSITVPVVAGGSRMTLAVDVSRVAGYQGPMRLELRRDQRTVARLPIPRAGHWLTLRTDSAIEWEAGRPLEIRLVTPRGVGARARVLVDRVLFSWP